MSTVATRRERGGAEPRPRTIGSVCEELREQFPDISVSKIRYLEDQGLISPRRTRGGYRLFSPDDIERLSTILRLQRDEFLPLRVIREELDGPGAAATARDAEPSACSARKTRSTRPSCASAPRSRRTSSPARGVRPSRLARRRRRAPVRRERGGHRCRLRAAGALRHRRATPPDVPHRSRSAGSARRAARRAGPSLAERRAPEDRARGSRRARRASRRSSRTCFSFVTCARRWSARREHRPPRPDPRRPGLPERGDRLQGPHAARSPIPSISPRRSTSSPTGRGPASRDLIFGAEARGFIFGAALAYALGAGFIAARKPGKLPRETIEATYALEYGTDSLQVHRDAVAAGARVVVLDDVLATGGTAHAKVELVEELGGVVAGVALRDRARRSCGGRDAARRLRRPLADPVLSRTVRGRAPTGLQRGAWPPHAVTTERMHSRQGSQQGSRTRRCPFHECRRAHEGCSRCFDADARGRLSPRRRARTKGDLRSSGSSSDRTGLRRPPRRGPEHTGRRPKRTPPSAGGMASAAACGRT